MKRNSGKIIIFALLLLENSIVKAEEAAKVDKTSPAPAASPQKSYNKNVVTILQDIPELFGTFYRLLKKAGRLPGIEGAPQVTIFAPTNQAFKNLEESLGADSYLKLMGEAPSRTNAPTDLQQILNLHMVSQKKTAADLKKMKSITPFKKRSGTH